MTSATSIEWATDTWNPILGCSHASPGCDNCYAESLTGGRLAHVPAYAGLAVKGTDGRARFTGELRVIEDRILDPIRKRRPRRYFVNSMSDLFHPEVLKAPPIDGFPALARIFATMVAADHHQFLVLTKRPKIMAAVLRRPEFRLDVNAILLSLGREVMPGGMTDPDFVWPANIWVGTSIESDDFSWRADALRDCPTAIRFVSAEPLLGPLTSLDLTGIDWMIVGGESGPRARPMAESWATELRDRCVDDGVAFHFKQWGEWSPAMSNEGTHLMNRWTARHVPIESATNTDGHDLVDRGHAGWSRIYRPGKKLAGRRLDGRTWDEEPAALGVTS